MKKILALLSLLLCFSPGFVSAAAEPPTCVLMKFTDDTRYQALESADTLSDLVMEKMLAAKKFRLMETRPLDENMEVILYDENRRDLEALQKAMGGDDFSAVFEGPGFREDRAQSIASAAKGQFIAPTVTASLGEAHSADYLIQGTVIQLGTGNWWNDDLAKISQAVNLVSTLAGAPAISNLMGNGTPLGTILSGFDLKVTGIGVQCDVRVIKAATGEVLWTKRVTGLGKQKMVGLGFASFGDDKLNSELYSKAMNEAAQKIVEALIQDMDEVFV